MTRTRRLLLLGGTTEASALARRLAGRPGLSVVTSLAGRTSRPAVPPGELRVGGFGGTAGLLAYLLATDVALVVDATHPFAAVMRWHAAQACSEAGVPRLRVERPAWVEGHGDRWVHAGSMADAGRLVAAGDARRVLLATGRSELACFAVACDGLRWWLVRSIEPPDPLPLSPAEVVLGRGPFALGDELDLIAGHRIDLVVTRNSGGGAAGTKIEAARALGVKVLVVGRPASPAGPVAATVDEAVAWVAAQLEAPAAPHG